MTQLNTLITLDDLIGERCLLKTSPDRNSYNASTSVQEYRILEVSPTGNWVRLANAYGNKFWRPTLDVTLVEVLKPLVVKEPRPNGKAKPKPRVKKKVMTRS